jgi:hypothetical protein
LSRRMPVWRVVAASDVATCSAPAQMHPPGTDLSHEAAIREVTPSALGCEECLKHSSAIRVLRFEPS